jgi:hypothetical protein
MVQVRYSGQYQSMVLLNPVCDPSPPLAAPTQRATRLVADRFDRAWLKSAAGKKSPRPSPGADFDVERYSSAILRPLTAACVFRDCSLRTQAPAPERRACRTLMRQAALKWRHGLPMGDL